MTQRLLQMLARSPGMTAGERATRADVAVGDVGQPLGRLERAGHVVRSRRRRPRWSLTPQPELGLEHDQLERMMRSNRAAGF